MRILQSWEEWNAAEYLAIPIFTDHRQHPRNNRICLVGLVSSTDIAIASIIHPDAPQLPLDALSLLIPHYVPNKKVWLHHFPNNVSILDVESMEYLQNGTITSRESFYTKWHQHMYQKFDTHDDINLAIPLMRHLECIVNYSKHLWNIIDQHHPSRAYEFFNTIALPTLQKIEYTGIQVDTPKLERRYTTKILPYVASEKIYSEYNIYTATGRPSNRYSGINFAGLNKSDGTRGCFVSKGQMVMYDMESYHLRLIANLLNYEFPANQSIHEFLGRQYFEVDTLTPEQYEESKKKSFQYLYAEHHPKDAPDFFQQVYRYIDELWQQYELDGYIDSPLARFQIKSADSKSKMFNYMIQWLETETNLYALSHILPLFQDTKSKVIMYLYDAIFIDIDTSENTIELLTQVENILSYNGKYPLRKYIGTTMHTLEKITVK